MKTIKSKTYHVSGMHCASCEILIEKKLLTLDGVGSVDASTKDGTVRIAFTKDAPSVDALNILFGEDNYTFAENKETLNGPSFFSQLKQGRIFVSRKKLKDFFLIIGISTIVLVSFSILSRLGFITSVNVSESSNLPLFFLFGLMAGLSSCAALVGGIVLSMTKQWIDLYGKNVAFTKRLEPHLIFNAGRLLSYSIFGALLGLLGSFFSFSPSGSAMLIIIVSLLMIVFSLQMLGIKFFQKFQIRVPKVLTRFIADKKNINARFMPGVIGALTFFLPCGFTVTTQGIAIASGDALKGSLIMFFFALGTLPVLLMIGITSSTFTQKPHISNLFLKTAGVIVFFFALFNINSQMNVLGFLSFSDISLANVFSESRENLSDVVPETQIIKIRASSSGYEPDYIQVKAGIPVRLEIMDNGTSGCTNAIIAKGLFDGTVRLTQGEVSVKEFTPMNPGRYKFSCWMGMVSGIIEVVD